MKNIYAGPVTELAYHTSAFFFSFMQLASIPPVWTHRRLQVSAHETDLERSLCTV
jgi:hypothetical protein